MCFVYFFFLETFFKPSVIVTILYLAHILDSTGKKGTGSSEEVVMTVQVGQRVLPLQWVCPETLGKALNTTSFSEKRALLILFAHRSPNTWRYSNITYTLV